VLFNSYEFIYVFPPVTALLFFAFSAGGARRSPRELAAPIGEGPAAQDAVVDRFLLDLLDRQPGSRC
jgi:hypothetical protein